MNGKKSLARLPALVLLAAVIIAFAGYWFDLGEPMPEGQQTQPEGGVFTVKGVENGSHYEVELYDYPDDDVAGAADLKDLMNQFELAAVGLGTAGNKTLALWLVTLDGENFTADGDFLVVLKQVTKDDSAPLRYKAAVPFIGGSATILKYSTLKTAKVEPSVSSYTVTVHTNGGTPADFTQEVQSGGKITEPPAPQRTGCTFDGWYKDAAGTNKWDFDKDTVTTNITLYAKWTRNTYKVTFDTGGVAPVPAIQDVPYGDYAKIPADTKEGHILDGWYKENTKTNKWNFDTDTVKENITLYGTWTRTYTVTFNLNGASGTAPVHPAVLYGGKITEPPAPQWAGWTFEAWYKEAACTNPWNFVTDTVTTDITLYAKWSVWLLSKRTNYNTDGTIAAEEITEYTSYADETHYTYQRYPSGTTIPTKEYSRDGESSHDVYITRSANGDVVATTVYDYVYDADSGLIKQQTTTSSSSVTGTPSVTNHFYTVTLLDTDADGTKRYKRYVTSTGGTGSYWIYTIKDGFTLSESNYDADGLWRTKTYTFPDNSVIRERMPKLTVYSDGYRADIGYSDQHQTCELVESTDTTLTVKIKNIHTSTNSPGIHEDFTYTKRTLP